MTSLTRIGKPSNLDTGGTYDLLLVSTDQGYPVGKVLFKIGSEPRKITGIQKVAQIFMKTLFTSAGSDPIHPTSGTSFPNLTTGANILNSTLAFQSAVTASIADAEAQTKDILNSLNTDLSSQLYRVEVLSFDTATESASIKLGITTLDGEGASIAIPFPQTDLQLYK